MTDENKSSVAPSSKILFLSEQHVQQALDLQGCLDANEQSLMALTDKVPGMEAQVPTRLALPYKSDSTAAQDWTLFKPASCRLSERQGGESDGSMMMMGCKLVSVRAANPSRGLPLVPATIVLLNATTGQVQALVSATYLTAARTAAGSALATRAALLGSHLKSSNRMPMQHLVVFGAGLQAKLHIHCIALALGVKRLPRLTIVNRSLDRAQTLQKDLIQDGYTSQETSKILPLDHPERIAVALSTADCVVAATNTSTPLFQGTDLALDRCPRTCHINGIGSYTPEMEEIPSDFVASMDCQAVWIDTPQATEVGDLKGLVKGSQNSKTVLLGDILWQNQQQERHNSSSTDATIAADGVSQNESSVGNGRCTFYKAVGTAIQDVVTADLVVRRARELGIGTEVDMG